MTKREYIYILGLLIVLAVFSFKTCSMKMHEDKLMSQVATYSDLAKHYALKSGAEVATNNSLALTSQKQMEAFAKSLNDTMAQIVKKFKSVSNVTYLTNNFYAGGDTIITAGNIPCDFKPYAVRKSYSTYTFKGTVAKDFFSVDSLFIPNKIGIVSGRKKIGFMKWDYGVDVNNSNPLMHTSNIKSYQYVPQKKWYERTWVHMVAGALVQTGINKGINYITTK